MNKLPPQLRADFCVSITRRMVFYLGLAALTLSAPVCALEVNDLSFYAPLDGSLDAAFAAGDAAAQVGEKEIPFVPGIVGKAIHLGEPGFSLSYAVRDNISERQGSISMWVQPLFLASGANKHRNLMLIPGRMNLWYSHNSLIAFTTPQWQLASYPCVFGGTPKDWHHVVITWGNGKCVRYGDGILEDQLSNLSTELSDWGADGARFSLADSAGGSGFEATQTMNNKVALDELMIFKRPLNAVEVKSLYRHGIARLLKPTVRIGELPARPQAADDWQPTAALTDFVDHPFGNLSLKPVRMNLAYDRQSLYFLVRSPIKGGSEPANNLEIWLKPKRSDGKLFRFLLAVDGSRPHVQGATPTDSTMWEGRVFQEKGEECFEVAAPWKSLGITPTEGTAMGFNALRRWSRSYGDLVSWVDVSPLSSDPERYGEIVLAGRQPVLALKSLGRLDEGHLDLAADILGSDDGKPASAQVRLQPSDFRVIEDKALGLKRDSGAQLMFDQVTALKDGTNKVKAAASLSDQDLNSVWLKITDQADRIIYQAQRSFVAEPPVISTVKLFPSVNRIEIQVDASNCRDIPLDELSAGVRVLAPGKTVKAWVKHFNQASGKVMLSLKSLPVGKIKVQTVLNRKGAMIAEHETEFEKLAPGPWLGNRLGKDDIVIPPFIPVKVDSQSVSVWGRTYRWADSLFPVQITSLDEDLLAAPMELLAGGAPTGKPNPAIVKILEKSDTRAIVLSKGNFAGLSIVARHRIEYDGMCWTELEIRPGDKAVLEGLSLSIPYQPEQASLYHYVRNSGATKKLTANGKKAELGLQAAVWLGNEDRGMTWFTESNVNWRSGGQRHTATTDFDPGVPANLGWKMKTSAQCIANEGPCISLTVRFADQPFELTEPLKLAFGVIATPVRKIQDNGRFLRCGRDFGYCWNGVNPQMGGFTRSNNDIANIHPSWKEFLNLKKA